MFDKLINTQNLYANLNAENWVILDCRFDLLNPVWGHNEYYQGHIPGAVFADLNKHLSGAKTSSSGRHPLPSLKKFLRQLERWGISPDTQVVAYDANSGGFASRAWWLLRLFGHKNVAVLDGGWQQWITNNLPISKKIPRHLQTHYPNVEPDPSFYLSTKEMVSIVNDRRHLIIDVRAPERYRGEIEPIDPVAGHIPGAINRPIAENLCDDGTFKTPEQLKDELKDLLGDSLSRDAIIYCGSGVTSCHLVLAMESAGFALPRIYSGSWSEWIRNPERPTEK